ncbi:hypothetical protein A7Q10_03300 [Methylacidiphilum caldifontis]|uniref:Uncharacterized protein n=1 Tax=Methylacidiphilum caldifontis TaxID=2795386 RepID=A0A4Y8PHW0_9BACT|nr:hypothetical protein A7Q10_03300 [Methylacidiphilum caldifontis]
MRQYTRAAVDTTLKTGQRRSFGEAKPKDGYALRAILPRPKRRGKPAHLVSKKLTRFKAFEGIS